MIKIGFNKIEHLEEKQIAFLLFGVALFLRILYAIFHFYYYPLPATNLYYELAQEIISKGQIFYNTNNPYYDVVGPIIPWLNALTMLVFGKNYLGLYIITAFGSALTTLYTYKTARLFLDKRTSILIGFWSTIYLFYFLYTPTPGKDIWMSFLLIFLIYQLIKLFIIKEFNYRSYLFFIFLFVVSFHLDERYVIFSPFILFFILYYETSFFTKLRVKKSLLFIGFTILLMIPWTVRNYYKYNKVVILSTRTERYTDKLLGNEQKKEYFSDDFTSIKGRYYIADNQIDSVISSKKTVTDNGFKIPKVQAEAMKNGLRPSPLTGLNAMGSRLRTMFEPFQLKGHFEQTGYYYYKKSLRHNIATFLFYGIIFIFSFLGFYYLYQLNKSIFYLFLFTILIYALLHALTIPYTNWRYRLPLDAIIIITGCFGISRLYQKTVNG